MARFVSIYPKVSINSSTWEVLIKLQDLQSKKSRRIVRTFSAKVAVTEPLSEFKLVIVARVPNVVTLSIIEDAMFTRNIGTITRSETVWSRWQKQAEHYASVMQSGDRIEEYRSRWTKVSTKNIREGLIKLIVDNGGVILDIHHHEPDGSVTRG